MKTEKELIDEYGKLCDKAKSNIRIENTDTKISVIFDDITGNRHMKLEFLPIDFCAMAENINQFWMKNGRNVIINSFKQVDTSGVLKINESDLFN